MASVRGRRGARISRRLAVTLGILVLGVGILGVDVAERARPLAIAQLSSRIGQPLHVDGELSLHPALDGFTVRFSGLHVDQAAWAGRGDLLRVDKGSFTLPWTGLLGGVRLQDLQLDGLRLNLRRDSHGRPNWSDGRVHRPLRLPRIARIAIRDGNLAYQDQARALTFQGQIAVASDAAGPPVLTVRGHGGIEDGRWAIDARSTTDFYGSQPYVLSGRLLLDKPSGRSTAQYSGRFTPAGGGHLQATVDATGPDLHDPSHLINVPLPHTPAYKLHTLVDRTPKATRLQELSGRVGASDIAGTMSITPAQGGHHLDGALRSRSLRMSDLLSVASGGQLGRARRHGGLLPDAPINPVPLRKLTGALRLSAASVQAPSIRSLQLLATFDRGRVAAAPLTLTLAHGRAKVGFVLDVRGPIPKVRLDAGLRDADTSEFRNPGDAPPPLQAVFDADVHLQGAGPSLSAAAAHASGDMELAAHGGRLQQTQAAVLSANIVRGLFSVLGRSHADTPLQCAVARFEVRDGRGRATALHIMTGLGGVTGEGGFDLASETLKVTLRPASPMKAGLTSVQLQGPLQHLRPTLTFGNPMAAVGRVFTGFLHPALFSQPGPGCG